MTWYRRVKNKMKGVETSVSGLGDIQWVQPNRHCEYFTSSYWKEMVPAQNEQDKEK